MITAEKTDYDGWTIEAYCKENKPKDWKPGDPIPYAGWLTAQLTRPQQFPPGWTTAKRFTIPEHGERDFSDWSESYRALKQEAHERIDAIKRL
jgi:hypothetical protein